MVHMVRPTTNITAGELVLVNVVEKKAELMGTSMVLVDDKDGQEHQNIKFFHCQKMGQCESRCPYKLETSDGVHGRFLRIRYTWLLIPRPY